MKVGSLYIIRGGSAVGRFVSDGTFEMLKQEDNGNLVSTGFYKPSDTTPILWPMLPKTRRQYMKGDEVVFISNGVYTIFVSAGFIFLELNPEQQCIIESRTGWLEVKFAVPLQCIRTAKYAECNANCKAATICWLLISKRLRFPRDMRRFIGEMIWESRDAREWETRYEIRRSKKAK